MCDVQRDDGSKGSYLFWMLRAAGASAETDDQLTAGIYKCYMGVGGQMQYAFIDINITGPSSYENKGKAGKFRVEPSRQIVFESGPLTQYTSKLLAGPKIGLNADGGKFYNIVCGRSK